MSIEKSDFVEFSLEPLIKRIDESVERLEYEYSEETLDEYCVISYKNGFRRKVNISGDSEKSIVFDVLKML